MEFILFLILSDPQNTNVEIHSEVFASRAACEAAQEVISERIMDRHNIGRYSVICIARN